MVTEHTLGQMEEKYVGEYKDDKEWNGNEYNKVGNINWKYVNGKMIKQ